MEDRREPPAGGQRKLLLRALAGETLARPPWWLMRQAGRYLPEYRALRARAPGFIEFCLNPELASEATLQPVRRFGMDAAIVFADILLIPHALGQKVEFGEDGPILAPISAGADALQLFDTWAGVLSEAGFERWVIEPTRRITTRLKERFPMVSVIGFPRGAGLLYQRYVAESGVDAVSVDTIIPRDFARETLQRRVAVQGNLDPIALLVGGAVMRAEVQAIRRALGGGPFVFNLGHGV